MVSIGYARRLGMLAVAASVASLVSLPAPATALTVTVPTALPGPLAPINPFAPIKVPIGGSVSTGTGGDPIGVTVTVPNGGGASVTLPGLASLPALPVGPTGPVTGPITTPPVTTPVPDPAPGAVSVPPGSARGGDSDPEVALPGHETIAPRLAPTAAPHFAIGTAAPAIAPTPPPRANVRAAIATQPADSFLHRVPTIAVRLALWIALAAIVFALYLLVGSTVRQHRRKSPRVS